MNDTLACPICQNKLRTVKLKDCYLTSSFKSSNYFERTCNGTNHSLQFFTNEDTDQVEILKFSLNPKYSIFLEINYVDQSSRVYCLKKGLISNTIEISKMIVPDFPDLVNLKEKIGMYVVFS
jgi:hypothetical protein